MFLWFKEHSFTKYCFLDQLSCIKHMIPLMKHWVFCCSNSWQFKDKGYNFHWQFEMFDQIIWFEEQNFFKNEMNANSISQNCAHLHPKFSLFQLKKTKSQFISWQVCSTSGWWITRWKDTVKSPFLGSRSELGSSSISVFSYQWLSWLGRGGGRDGGGALHGGGPWGGGGREPVGDGGAERELLLVEGRALFGGGVYIGELVEDGGGVDGRGGRVEVGEGGKWQSSLPSDRRRW